MSRLLLVSNRLPVTVNVEGGALDVQWSGGGLATGLRGVHEHAPSEWIGWPGAADFPDDDQRTAIDAELGALRCFPVYLSADDRRVLVKMEAEFAIGTLVAELTEYKPGRDMRMVVGSGM